MSWSELFGFDHSWEELTDLNSSDVLNIYQERDGGDGTYYDAMSRPFKVPQLALQDQKESYGMGKGRGISIVQLSHDNRFCATKCEATPKCVWIWDLVEMSLNSLLVQNEEVSDIKWSPRSHNLNVSTNSNRLFLWSPKGASVCQVPLATSTVVATG